MSNTLSINNVIFAGKLMSMQTSADSIDAIRTGWSSLGESSITLNEYVIMLEQMENIMGDYKRIINNDINSLEKLKNNFVKMDERLLTIWK